MIVLSKIFLFHLIFTLTHRQVPGTKRKHPTNQMINRVFAVRTGYEPNPLYLYISIRYIPCKLIVTI